MGNVKVKSKIKIDPAEWYGLNDIVQNNFFPWCKTIKSVRQWVLRDKNGKNILKANVVGEGTQKRYLIKGENITKFLSHVEAGSY